MMIWIPVELILEIFRQVQKLIGRCDFKLDCYKSMRLDQEYHNNLLAFALSSKEWTAIAQAELFRNIILRNRSKTGRFLELVRGRKERSSHAESSLSIRFGGEVQGDYYTIGLADELDEIALYCPNVVEISCYQVAVRLEYFRKSLRRIWYGDVRCQCHLLAGNVKKLKKLNLARGSIESPSTSNAPIQPFALPMTLLSLDYVDLSSPLDPSVLPLVRSLHLDYQTYRPVRLLLPQLASLRLVPMRAVADLNRSIRKSTSITSLSLAETCIVDLDDASQTFIKEKIVEFNVQARSNLFAHSSDSALVTIIAGSKVMKKVILDGSELRVEGQMEPQVLETFKVLNPVCKKKGIELWK
jgi:hypothetical protein